MTADTVLRFLLLGLGGKARHLIPRLSFIHERPTPPKHTSRCPSRTYT